MTTVSQKETFDPFKASSKFTKYCAGHEKYLWNHLSILPISAHTCQCVSNAQKMPLMPHGWRSVRCPAPFTQNKLKMSQMSHAFEEKWTYRSKNEHRATVKVDLRKQEKRAKRLVRACAVEMHIDISQVRNFCASRRRLKARAHSLTPDRTPGLYPYGSLR